MSRVAFLILAFFISNISTNCVRYTFEDDFEDLFHNEFGVCRGLESWDLRYYSAADITKPNVGSVSFVSPRQSFSCVSSFMFTMTGGGMVEVVIYMETTEQLDQIALIVNQYVANGNDGVVGTASNMAMDPSFVSGWHTLRITLFGNGVYKGYITIMGMASRNSTVLVDSFRYIPPNMDENLCRLYEEDLITTESPVTVTEPPVTTPESSVITTELLVTTMEPPIIITDPPMTVTQTPATTIEPPTTEPSITTTDAPMTTTESPVTATELPVTTKEPLVTTTGSPVTTTKPPEIITKPPATITEPPVISETTTQSPVTIPDTTTQTEHTCVRYTFEDNFEFFTNQLGYCYGMGFWGMQYYNTTDMTGQNERSVSFISPREKLSCVSSFMFPMTAGGMIEVNIFMDSANQFDQIAILANQYVANGNDIVVGSINHLAMGPNFVSGWHTLRFNLFGSGSYDGYISIMGLASPSSRLLVDSFRYVPPHMDESLCQLYEDDISTTELPWTSIETTAEPPGTKPETTTNLPETTIQPEYTCVEYTFEDNFKELFTTELGYCYGMGSWDVHYYNATDFTDQNERSVSFISPRERLSCVSSFIFPMTAGGTIEINIFMASENQFDQIAILANQYIANGNDVVVGSDNNLAMSPHFVRGWHTLRLNLFGSGTYNGYISIMGLASPRSTVLVDSFRYVPPNMDESLCRLYEDDVHTTGTPVTITQSPATTPDAMTQPSTTTSQPPVITTQPPITMPDTTTYTSVTTTRPPVTIPDTTTQTPITTTQPPVTKPDNSTQTPVTTTQSPVTIPDNTTQTPVTTTQPPVTKPDNTTHTPVTTTKPPATIADTTTELAETTTQPENTCVRYTFENNFNELFTNEFGPCGGRMELWDLKHYNTTDLMSQNEGSMSFISPRETFSCVSSLIFPITGGGFIEVNTYMESVDQTDQIAIFANHYVVDGNDPVTGLNTNSPLNADFVSGWRTLRFNVLGIGTYDGYISLMGMASPNSVMLVDSFRYVPPNMDESLCRLYEDDVSTTEPPVTTTQIPVTITQSPVTSHDTTTQPPVTTTELPVTIPDTTTQPPVTTTELPVTIPDITTQPPVTTTELPVTIPDTTTHTPVTATELPVTITDTTTQTPVTTTELPVTIPDTTTHTPVTATELPVTITDTTTQTPVTTTELPVTIPDTTMELPETTTQPEHTCVRYTFENDFDEIFTNEFGPCGGGMEFWDLKHYNATDLMSQNEGSMSFISPRETFSCVSSFIFPMTGGGLIEVNTYMESVDQSDLVTILANRYMVDGNYAVTGVNTNSPFNEDFVSGWRTLRFNVLGMGTYNGYISLMGMASPKSVVLVDSFRYVPPNMDESLCRLYEDDAITN